MDLKRFARRKPSTDKHAPTPETVHRRMLGQSIIDKVLSASGPLVGPASRKLEGLWLDALAHPALSRTAERLSEKALPRPIMKAAIDAWIQAYDVDMSVADVPPEGFATLDAFFTRKLKSGVRPVDHDPDVLVSPADSILKSFGPIDPRGRIPEVKGRTYSIAELLEGAGDPTLVDALVGGSYGVYYLSPRDYHRVHAPTNAVVTAVTPLAGASYPVNALGVRRIEGLFVRNKRTVFTLETDDGPVLLVMVGATNVGRITASVAAGERIERGQELGIFHLGSTVVLLTTRASRFAYTHVHEGEAVRFGQAVLHRS